MTCFSPLDLTRSLLSSFLFVPRLSWPARGAQTARQAWRCCFSVSLQSELRGCLGSQASPGQGACQGDQCKREGLEFPLLGLSQAKNSTEIFGCVDACVQNGLILTLILGWLSPLGNLWSQTRIFFIPWGVFIRQHALSWTPCGWITLVN